MKTQYYLIMAALGLLSIVVAVVGCSDADETKQQRTTIVDSVSDEIASSFADDATEYEMSRLDTEDSVDRAGSVYEPQGEPAVEIERNPLLVSYVNELALVDNQLYGVYDGGIVVYDFTSKTARVVRSGVALNSLAFHEGRLYVGGDGLFTLSDTVLTTVDLPLDAEITALRSWGHRLVIGTRDGLFANSILGYEDLLDDKVITALAGDPTGLWVGTDGDGLYRWDGETFKRRYLLRDESIFDCVNALDYSRGHLYLGTTEGMFVFNGGVWTQLTVDNGLPSNNVWSIDASDWIVYAVTDAGVVSYFNNELTLVESLQKESINDVVVRNGLVIAATDFEGVIARTKGGLRTLVAPDTGVIVDVLSLAW